MKKLNKKNKLFLLGSGLVLAGTSAAMAITISADTTTANVESSTISSTGETSVSSTDGATKLIKDFISTWHSSLEDAYNRAKNGAITGNDTTNQNRNFTIFLYELTDADNTSLVNAISTLFNEWVFGNLSKYQTEWEAKVGSSAHASTIYNSLTDAQKLSLLKNYLDKFESIVTNQTTSNGGFSYYSSFSSYAKIGSDFKWTNSTYFAELPSDFETLFLAEITSFPPATGINSAIDFDNVVHTQVPQLLYNQYLIDRTYISSQNGSLSNVSISLNNTSKMYDIYTFFNLSFYKASDWTINETSISNNTVSQNFQILSSVYSPTESGLTASFALNIQLGNYVSEFDQEIDTQIDKYVSEFDEETNTQNVASVSETQSFVHSQLSADTSNGLAESIYELSSKDSITVNNVTTSNLKDTALLTQYMSWFDLTINSVSLGSEQIESGNKIWTQNSASYSLTSYYNESEASTKNEVTFYLSDFIDDGSKELSEASQIVPTVNEFNKTHMTVDDFVEVYTDFLSACRTYQNNSSTTNKTNSNLAATRLSLLFTYSDADTTKYVYRPSLIRTVNNDENSISVNTTVYLVGDTSKQITYTNILPTSYPDTASDTDKAEFKSTITTEKTVSASDRSFFNNGSSGDKTSAESALANVYGSNFTWLMTSAQNTVTNLFRTSISDFLVVKNVNSVSELNYDSLSSTEQSAIHTDFKNIYQVYLFNFYKNNSKTSLATSSAAIAAAAALATLNEKMDQANLDDASKEKLISKLTESNKEALAALTSDTELSAEQLTSLLEQIDQISELLETTDVATLLDLLAGYENLKIASDTVAGATRWVGIGLLGTITLASLIVAARGSLARGVKMVANKKVIRTIGLVVGGAAAASMAVLLLVIFGVL